ncbi:hypothetical protein AB0D11_02300 [Streptomyces monashensis]|uniref:hypothetical protein n=1 Tax=Streptomyces monashensis TaxID=1678012 RepID=UPI0033CFA81B
MTARTWLYERLVGACINPERVAAELDAHQAEAIGQAIAHLHAVPVQCTALTGPVWYGSGWKDCITTLEEIADYRLPDGEAYPGELQRLRARVRELRAAALRNEDLPRVQQILVDHAAYEAQTRSDKAAPDFFQPDHTYLNTRLHWRFRCDAVTTHPDTGKHVAIGWSLFSPGDSQTGDMSEEEWAEVGWTDVTEAGEGR